MPIKSAGEREGLKGSLPAPPWPCALALGGAGGRIRVMRRPRTIALISLGILTVGSLAITGGYAWYLRSAAYRNYCANVLAESLGLPSDIARVVPRSHTAREFQKVRVWLPEKRDEAAFCERAIVTYTPIPADPDAWELELRGGRTEISTRTWLRDDYRVMLESGLRPGFDPNGPRRVIFSGMDLRFDRDRFQMTLNDASGVVLFEDRHVGRARITCQRFNDQLTGEPVTLRAEFSPQTAGIKLDLVELVIPDIPIERVRLRELVGINLQTGTFNGQVRYREQVNDRRETTIRGSLRELQLGECSAHLLDKPWRGTVPQLDLQELTLLNRRFERLRFAGLLTGVVLGDVLAPLGLGNLGGKLELRVTQAELDTTGILRLVAAGHCDDIALEEVSTALGWGTMTGTATLTIDDLHIADNHLAALDATIRVKDANGDEQNTIDRSLVVEVLQRAFNVTLPAMLAQRLPERFPYDQLGVRLEVRDESLYVFGTHGPREQSILTVELFNQPITVVRQPQTPIDLQPQLDRWRREMLSELTGRLETLRPGDAWQLLALPPDPPPNVGPEPE